MTRPHESIRRRSRQGWGRRIGDLAGALTARTRPELDPWADAADWEAVYWRWYDQLHLAAGALEGPTRAREERRYEST